MLGQGGDGAAVAGVPILNTHVTTFVLVRVTFLSAGVPLVSACVATFHPTIFSRTVADDLTLGVGGVGGTILERTFVVTWL